MPRTYLTGAARDRVAAEVAARYAAGETIGLIAKRTGRSYGTTHSLLLHAGMKPRPRGHQRLDVQARVELAAHLARRYEAGATVQGLAAEMGRSYTLARALLLEVGVTMRPKGTLKGTKRGSAR
ncbi:helix-turn-helix domain-containing protein [Streptomyces sp. NPDC053079]|uniref:helix-turn-helix domain-containing protein n=1 Tax=Streptomyces sp. NPDC053079 TaxID=3365697 RepID=UPI0037D975B6